MKKPHKITNKKIFKEISKKVLTNHLFRCIILSGIWVWRRLVARYLGVVEVAGSNPVTQTNLLTFLRIPNGVLKAISKYISHSVTECESVTL